MVAVVVLAHHLRLVVLELLLVVVVDQEVLVGRILVLLHTPVELMLYLQHQMLMVGVMEEMGQIQMDIGVMVQVVVEQVV